MTELVFYTVYVAQLSLQHKNINVPIFRMKVCERRRTELYAKQGRKNQFTTAEARDRWITEVNCIGDKCKLPNCMILFVIGIGDYTE